MGAGTPSRSRRGERSPVLRWLGVGVLSLVLLGVGVAAGLAGRGMLDGLFDLPGPTTVDRSEPAVLLAVRDMAELRAASGQYHVIVDVEEDVPFLPSALVGDRTLFVALGTVDAAVDLAGLAEDAVQVGADGTSVRLDLPAADLTEPRIDPDGSYVYDRQEGLLNRLEAVITGELSDDQALYQQASDMLTDAAAESDLRQRAETNTRSLLDSLLRSLGFTDVDIHFAEPPG